MKNSYLLLDCGNTLTKAAIYEPIENKIAEWKVIPKTQNGQDLLGSFTTLKDYKIIKVFASITAKQVEAQPFIQSLVTSLNVPVKTINKDDFIGIINFDNIKSDVVIGSDILLSAYYGICTSKKGAIFCFGTVYFGVVYEDKTIVGVQLLPNLVISLNDIATKTSIAANLLPSTFDKQIGLTTPDAFSSGINLSMEGFVDNVIKHYGIESNEVIITGGDNKKFANLAKYKLIDHLVVLAIAMLTKQKGW